MLKPGGVLTYSVCTFGTAEGAGVVEAARQQVPSESLPPLSAPWSAREGMSVIVPGATDGMMLHQLRRL